MIRRNIILVIALVLVIPAMLVGCSETESAARTEPEAFEDTLKGFFSAYNSGDYDKCLTYMLGMSFASEGARDAMKTGLRKSHGNTGDIKVTSIENITICESSGTADAVMTFGGRPLEGEVMLFKEGYDWKVDFEKLCHRSSQE